MDKLFAGVRVIDFSNNVAGPCTAAMLADFGADVIKVEKPVTGDDSRGYSPSINGHGLSGLWLNRGKRSIALNLKNPIGKSLFLELLNTADVLIESSRPGVMKRLGLDYETLKDKFPRLIMLSISGFGQTGPYRDLPGYDIIAQAASGLMYVNGFPDNPPTRVGPAVSDYVCAHNGFGAISAALYYREKSGKGQQIDLSVAECALSINDYIPSGFLDPKIKRTGNHHALMAPYGVFNCSHGSISLGAINPSLWERLCHLMGCEEYISKPGFETAGKRATPESNPKVVELIETWLESTGDIKVAERLLRENGIPCFHIMTLQELKVDPHYDARGTITELQTPMLPMPTLRVRGNHIHMSETPGQFGVPPLLNQHADEILFEVLGHTEAEKQEMILNGAFGNQYGTKDA